MKYYKPSYSFLIFVLLGLCQPIYAQLTKEETAQLKKEIGKLSVEKLKQMKDERASLDEQAATRNAQIVQKRAELGNIQNDITKKDDGIEYLEEQLRKLKGQIGEVNGTKQGRGSHDCAFSVQIGAYKNQDLTRYMEQHPNFGVETDESGFKKYTIGYFTSYWEAKSFSKYLDQTGAQTYVVGFFKGKRIPDLKDMTQCTF
jgi:hypothetical protein